MTKKEKRKALPQSLVAVSFCISWLFIASAESYRNDNVIRIGVSAIWMRAYFLSGDDWFTIWNCRKIINKFLKTMFISYQIVGRSSPIVWLSPNQPFRLVDKFGIDQIIMISSAVALHYPSTNKHLDDCDAINSRCWSRAFETINKSLHRCDTPANRQVFRFKLIKKLLKFKIVTSNKIAERWALLEHFVDVSCTKHFIITQTFL